MKFFKNWFTNRKVHITKAPIDFVELESKNESTKHLPKLPLNWLTDLEAKYLNSEEYYPTEYTEQCEKLCNDVYKLSKYWEHNNTHTEFINELTKEQKIYFALINFESQVNNGGVYQFLFNYSELSIVALESMRIVKMERLAKDYEDVLNEYFGKFKTIRDLHLRFQNENSHWDKRWNAFAEGYKELKTASKIEDYFYEKSFIKDFQDKMVQFVKQNKEQLLEE